MSEKCWRSRANLKPAFRKRLIFLGVKNDRKGIKIVGEGLDIPHLESRMLWHTRIKHLHLGYFRFYANLQLRDM